MHTVCMCICTVLPPWCGTRRAAADNFHRPAIRFARLSTAPAAIAAAIEPLTRGCLLRARTCHQPLLHPLGLLAGLGMVLSLARASAVAASINIRLPTACTRWRAHDARAVFKERPRRSMLVHVGTEPCLAPATRVPWPKGCRISRRRAHTPVVTALWMVAETRHLQGATQPVLTLSSPARTVNYAAVVAHVQVTAATPQGRPCGVLSRTRHHRWQVSDRLLVLRPVARSVCSLRESSQARESERAAVLNPGSAYSRTEPRASAADLVRAPGAAARL